MQVLVENARSEAPAAESSEAHSQARCTNVPDDAIAAALLDAAAHWCATHDPTHLQRALLRILTALSE